LNARYSRNLEREAHAYAVNALRAIGIRPTRLADMLDRMEAEHSRAGGESPTGAFAYRSTTRRPRKGCGRCGNRKLLG
jgi:predicted Zn-dependent protease